MIAYPLRNIDDDLWRTVKIRAMTDGLSVRDVIELGLKLYAAHGREALEVSAGREKTAKRKSA